MSLVLADGFKEFIQKALKVIGRVMDVDDEPNTRTSSIDSEKRIPMHGTILSLMFLYMYTIRYIHTVMYIALLSLLAHEI